MARLREFIRAAGDDAATPSEVVLAPWPTSEAAVALAEDYLARALGIDDEAEARRLGEVAAELVQRYAAGAPQPVKNEAAVRVAGWLCEQPAAAVRSESVGDIRTSYMPSHVGALLHSGAAGLLSPWKERRAGAIG